MFKLLLILVKSPLNLKRYQTPSKNIAMKTKTVMGLDKVSKSVVRYDDITFFLLGREGVSFEKRNKARMPHMQRRIPPIILIQKTCPIK